MSKIFNKNNILGADEVGYGAIAGSLIIAGIRAPNGWSIPGLKDSKQLSDKQRRKLNEQLLKLSARGDIQIAYAERSNIEIDQLNVYVALKECYREIAQKLYKDDTKIIIDGSVDFSAYLRGFDYEVIVKADTFVPQVMAASIVGKVYRDDLMIKLSSQFPEYKWNENKGYYNPPHVEAIKKYGRTIYHRKSYKLKILGEK